MMARSLVALLAAIGSATARSSLLWKEDSGHEAGHFPLAFGVELEYLFPRYMADIAYNDRLDVVKKLLDESMTTSSTEQHNNPRFPPVIFDDYYVAHNTSSTEIETWKIVPDASLVGPAAGFELVSPVMRHISKEELVDELTSMLVVMETQLGATLSESTDLHVHINVTGAEVGQIRSIYQTFLFFERAFDEMQPPNHRGNEDPYCQSLLLSFSNDDDSDESLVLDKALHTLDKCTTLACLKETAQPFPGKNNVEAQRYYKLNYSVKENGDSATMEFRGHHGTLDPVAVYLWVHITTALVDQSMRNPRWAHELVQQKKNESGSSSSIHGTMSDLITAVFPEKEWKTELVLAHYHDRQRSFTKFPSIYMRRVLGLEELYGRGSEKPPSPPEMSMSMMSGKKGRDPLILGGKKGGGKKS